jgi:hypothetical protein
MSNGKKYYTSVAEHLAHERGVSKDCSNCKHGAVLSGLPCADCNKLHPEKDGHENTTCNWESRQ